MLDRGHLSYSNVFLANLARASAFTIIVTLQSVFWCNRHSGSEMFEKMRDRLLQYIPKPNNIQLIDTK